MSTRKSFTYSFLSITILFLLLLSISHSNSTGISGFTMPKPMRNNMLSEEVNIIEDSGFESGVFETWINSGDTEFNQIQSDRVYSGDYALFMDSHFSQAPYERVVQSFYDVTLKDASWFRAYVYPTKVGNTAGQAGVDNIRITIMNIETEVRYKVFYEWSGYTYPLGDGGVNVTSKVVYLLFDLVPNSWNLIDRDLLSDYTAFFGTPENTSLLQITEIDTVAHISNGDPGDFWVDDIQLTNATGLLPSSTSTDLLPSSTPSDLTYLLVASASSTITVMALIWFFARRKEPQPDYMHPEYVEY